MSNRSAIVYLITLIACAFISISALAEGTVKLDDEPATSAQLRQELYAAEDLVRQHSNSPNAYVERGMVLFSLGRVQDSLVDFDKAIELDKSVKPDLWQRGIALYYLDQFDEAAAQFKTHHDVNPDDVENTAWYFLCLAKAKGLSQARADIVPSRGDSRPPMMEVLKMYSGQMTTAELVALIKDKDAMTQFYGNLYIGLYYEAIGETATASTYVKKAVDTRRGGYMLRVAMVDLAARQQREAANKKIVSWPCYFAY